MSTGFLDFLKFSYSLTSPRLPGHRSFRDAEIRRFLRIPFTTFGHHTETLTVAFCILSISFSLFFFCQFSTDTHAACSRLRGPAGPMTCLAH